MNDTEFQKYVSLLQSMCLDVAMGGITQATFINNLRMMTAQLSGEPDKIAAAIPFLEQLHRHVHRSCHSERLAFNAMSALGHTPQSTRPTAK